MVLEEDYFDQQVKKTPQKFLNAGLREQLRCSSLSFELNEKWNYKLISNHTINEYWNIWPEVQIIAFVSHRLLRNTKVFSFFLFIEIWLVKLKHCFIKKRRKLKKNNKYK
jgi:hypothetical protein